MAYTLSNKCAKNLCKRTVIFQIIIKVWSRFFLEHDVYIYISLSCTIFQLYDIEKKYCDLDI